MQDYLKTMQLMEELKKPLEKEPEKQNGFTVLVADEEHKRMLEEL